MTDQVLLLCLLARPRATPTGSFLRATPTRCCCGRVGATAVSIPRVWTAPGELHGAMSVPFALVGLKRGGGGTGASGAHDERAARALLLGSVGATVALPPPTASSEASRPTTMAARRSQRRSHSVREASRRAGRARRRCARRPSTPPRPLRATVSHDAPRRRAPKKRSRRGFMTSSSRPAVTAAALATATRPTRALPRARADAVRRARRRGGGARRRGVT